MKGRGLRRALPEAVTGPRTQRIAQADGRVRHHVGAVAVDQLPAAFAEAPTQTDHKVSKLNDEPE